MAPTTSRPWPPPSTADRARRSVGERLPRLSTPCCDPVRLVLRRPIESGPEVELVGVERRGSGVSVVGGGHVGEAVPARVAQHAVNRAEHLQRRGLFFDKSK